MSDSGPFLVTSEYRRFAEFCDACRQYRYIGLCHGPPGVGKSLSARRYAAWDRFETLSSVWQADDDALAAFEGADTVVYTPEIVNSPRSVADGVTRLCANVRNIREEPRRRAESAAAKAKAREEEQRQHDIMLKMDWFSPLPAQGDEPPALPQFSAPVRQPPLAPVRLVLVDEADRLKVMSLEQLRDLFDRSDAALVLIGMPGIEKRLARYPQLYSRVGFVHAFRTLRAEEMRRLLTDHWPEMGRKVPSAGISDREAVATIIRVTGGNFRLLHRLLSQIERILTLNRLEAVTPDVVEAARESLVIGTA
jgi:DNA transposition AAA+ family ATPase